MDASQLGRYIERIEMQTSLSRADVQTSAHAISICFSKPGALLDLQISCEQLDWQLSSMAQICDHFSPFLSRVENLGIFMAKRSTVQDDMDREQWVELIRAFGNTEEFRVAGELATDILRTLCPVDGMPIMLPSLRSLGLPELMQTHGPLWEAAQSFLTLRLLSGCPVEPCAVCHPQDLRRHLVDTDAHGPKRQTQDAAPTQQMFIPMNMSPQMQQQQQLMQQHAAQAQASGRVGGYPMYVRHQLQNVMHGPPSHTNLAAVQAAQVHARAQVQSQGAVPADFWGERGCFVPPCQRRRPPREEINKILADAEFPPPQSCAAWFHERSPPSR
ncbi:hypothetical protein EDB84DRAFT_1674071 [Lactarius hengduanensis]|nr:hypothetical protein EDB84DRAFT_1674071 [Lactarius hengduanensis]